MAALKQHAHSVLLKQQNNLHEVTLKRYYFELHEIPFKDFCLQQQLGSQHTGHAL